MTVKTYLGIDESNHGRNPEIIVAVASCDQKDITPDVFQKERDREKIKSVLENTEFKYVLFSNEYRSLLGDKGMVLVGVCELIGSFKNIETVIIDGEVPTHTLDEIRKVLYPNCPTIKIEPHADEKYAIVNTADMIANLLHHHYERFKSTADSKKYLQNIVTPRIEKYKSLLPLI